MRTTGSFCETGAEAVWHVLDWKPLADRLTTGAGRDNGAPAPNQGVLGDGGKQRGGNGSNRLSFARLIAEPLGTAAPSAAWVHHQH